jgi:hypothetical protein
MLSKTSISFDSPRRKRALTKQFIEFDITASRIDKEMDRFVGKTASSAKWKTIKRKYSLHSASSRTTSKLPLDP